jgi:esterase/lipase superfamily enzyme
VEAQRRQKEWEITILPDQLDDRMKREVGLRGEGTVYASKYVSRKLIKSMQRGKRPLLFFVHGYNNDVRAVLDRAEGLAELYNVEVLPFSWPSNGGGIKGLSDVSSDRRDARASVGALDRCFIKISEYLAEFHAEYTRQVAEKFPNNPELREGYMAENPYCPLPVNMLLHSMGNYLYKCLLESSAYRGTMGLFDNVILTAADAKNEGHAPWVDKILCRNRVYVTINENDSALRLSSKVASQEHYPRLGQYPHNLDSRHAVYVNFTDAKGVGKAHAYFEGEPVKNRAVLGFFDRALKGLRAEDGLAYDSGKNLYRLG